MIVEEGERELGSGFFFQAEVGIRDRVASRGLGEVYTRQESDLALSCLRSSRARLQP